MVPTRDASDRRLDMTDKDSARCVNHAKTQGGEQRHSVVADVREIVGDLWRYRELLYELTMRDIRIRYKQAAMGFAWAVFMPAMVVLAGLLVRFAMAYLSGNELAADGVGSVALKALPWSFFVGAIGFATASLTANPTLVTKVYFPREVLPLSATLAQAFDTTVSSIVFLFVLPFLGAQFSLALLWVPFLAALLFLFTTAAALLLSSANLFFRDVKYVVQVLLTFGIFFTPVFFEPAMFGPVGFRLMMLNPLAPLLEGVRLSVMDGHNLFVPLVQQVGGTDLLIWTPLYLAYGLVWAVAGLAVSSVLFHRLEYVFAEYV